jgi:hypothetical protein
MFVLPTALWAHPIGNLAALLAAGLSAWCQYRVDPRQMHKFARLRAEPSYYWALALGAILGAWLVGSLITIPISLAPSHSLAGALAGGIVFVELWKWRQGVHSSTGSTFVLPLTVGIIVGRMGCLFSGLSDYTYGVRTQLAWAVDLGDGVGRHPVQVYESLAMALFLALFIPARRRQAPWATVHAFHFFVIYYAAQRFCWEFFKPYPKLIGPFNLFHLLCGGLIVY